MQKKEKMHETVTAKKNNLEELLPIYFDANVQAKYFKEEATKIGDEIKKICLTENLSKGESGQFKFSVSKQVRSSFDEEVLLDCVKKLDPEVRKKVIKVKEYVDAEELEKAVYLGVIKPEEIKPAQIEKEVVALRVTKK